MAEDMTNALRSSPVSHRRRLRLAGRAAIGGAALVLALALASAVAPGDGRVIEAAGEPLGAGGEYHELTPVRILDTRDPGLDVGGGRKPTGPGEVTFDLPIAGNPHAAGLPAFADANGDGDDDNVLAVAVNVTVVHPTQPGYLQAYGAGTTRGETSVVNFFPGQVVPNSAILRPGAGGKLTIRLFSQADGAADVLVDLVGWFSSSNYGTGGARVVPIAPGRVFDSRNPAFGHPLGGREVVDVPVRGARVLGTGAEIVPNDGNVVGVLVNLTGVNTYPGSRPTYVAAVPRVTPGVDPGTSNLNLVPGQVRSSMSFVPVADDGTIRLFNLDGQADVIVDITGYLIKGRDPGTRAGRIVPLRAPFRAFDTRDPEFGESPLGPANAEDWSFEDFVGDVRIGSESVGPQLGLIGNLTATGLERQYPWAPQRTFLTAFPSPADGGNAVPEVSNITIGEGETIPNTVVLNYGSNSQDPACQGTHCLRFYNLGGYLHYLLDVSAVVLSD